MKKSFYSFIVIVVLTMVSPLMANAFDIKDVLGGSGVGGTVGNLIEGVFTKTNLDVSDMAGVWTVDGSAVTFKSDNLLKKAGGVAAAAAIESKLDPYYKQLGLTGGTLTINNDSTFNLKVKMMSLSGSVSKNSDGTFDFKFKALGKVSLGSIKTYVQKSGSTLEVMFDATKLKKILSTVAGLTGNSIAKTAGSVLDGYDGLCVGFHTTKSGNVSDSGATKSTKTTSEGKQSTTTNSSSDAKSKVGDALKGLFGK
ncbi:MAG: DUF4923 family protein [Muribaculaceae bacterium]|nr:DUF4923 family protein [Muribaculaceae bacterium]